MKFILTEKPSVAKDIAKVLKATQKRDGFFEGNGWVISWAFGHLIRLADPPAYNPAFEKWNLNDLPIIPDAFIKEIQADDGIKKQFETIKYWLNNETVESIVCATDAGREGELIFRHIYEMAGCQKPIQRLWISSQTDQAILEGFGALKSGQAYQSLYDSALSRSEADWIIGINATRAYTGKFSRGQGVMSVGRVQTPVLKLIVDRYKANTEFSAQAYWELEAEFEHANGNYKGLWQKTDGESRLQKKEEADSLFEAIKEQKQGKIHELNQKQVTEKPPLLYDLTEIQKEANRLYKLSADDTLKIMQALYERHKILTYPRTSSRYLSNDLKPKMENLLKQVGETEAYAPFVTELSLKPLVFSKRVFDDAKVTDHHAIIPTEKKPDWTQLSEQERLLYHLVLKRFVAAFMPDCIKDQTELFTTVDNHLFRSFGSIIKVQGWRAIYAKSEAMVEEDGDNQVLPAVQQGDAVNCLNYDLKSKKTKAPPLHTEATLLAAMETAGKTIEDEELRQAMKHCGLGTPATRAQILERLIAVGYVVREKNKLLPTAKGIHLISCIQHKALLSAELTGDWEKKLNDMVQNAYERSAYMNEIKAFAKEIVGSVVQHSGVLDLENSEPVKAAGALGDCPKCGSSIVETKMAFSCAGWKLTGCDFKIWKTIASKPLTAAQAKTLLKDKKTKVIKGFKSKEGKKFDAALTLAEDGRVVFVFDNEAKSVGVCPKCGGQVLERSKVFGCENWKTAPCDFAIFKDIAGHSLSTESAKELLEKGKTGVLTGFKSKAGKPFETALALQDGRVKFI